MKDISIPKTFNQIILIYLLVILILSWTGKITYGYGLGDLFFAGGLIIIVVIHVVATLIIDRSTTNKIISYWIVGMIFLIIAIKYSYNFTMGRGVEYPWNGKIFYEYSETNLRDLYNLAFGDKNLETGEIDDTIVSNNGDSEKVLATVVSTVYAFCDKHPESWIFATGSTKSRTRLYRMGITKYIDEIGKDFDVYGLRNNEWEEFVKEIEYDAFLVKHK